MKTEAEIEALKKNWLSDPCWDIEDTDGFEEYKAELREFRRLTEMNWRAAEYCRVYDKARDLGIENLGDKNDEPNLNLMKYLERLEIRITQLEKRCDKIES
jgi:hypothetical protein